MPCLGHDPNPSELGKSATPKVTISLPSPYVGALDSIATRAQYSRSEVIRQAIRQYLEDDKDLAAAATRLQDSGDSTLSWDEVKESLCD